MKKGGASLKLTLERPPKRLDLDRPGEIGGPIMCGGVRVNPGDVVVADEDGIVVVPRARAEMGLKNGRAKTARDAPESLPESERKHRARVENTPRAHGYLG
jgi:4-hydroxy-4-methyl-2-oxoglutarate aldolase